MDRGTALVDDEGRRLDARFFVEVWDGALTLVMESRSGGLRGPRSKNLGYAKALALLLARLGALGATLREARVESQDTVRDQLPPEACVIHMRDHSYPVPLANQDAEALRLNLTRGMRMAGTSRQLTASKEELRAQSSGAWKRARLWLDVPGYDAFPHHATLLQRRLALGAVVGPNPYAPEPVDPNLTEDAYREALTPPAGETDAQATVRRRREQAFLRQSLLRGRNAAPCDLCGRVFPPGFLVAAHIKPRHACTEEERLDPRGAVMLACRFGCDALFELGCVWVDAEGVVREGATLPEAEARRCVGRRCTAYSTQTAPRFVWHARHHGHIPPE